jgi:hypothetical protein
MIRASDRIHASALAGLWHRAASLAVGLALVLGPVAGRPADAARQEKASAAAPARPPSDAEPREAIIAALEAACNQNAQQFSRYLLAGSQRTFTALPEAEQKTLLKRISLTSLPGHAQPFLDVQGQTVVRCSTPAETVTYRLEPPEIDQNVAFVAVTVSGGEKTDLGMVRQPSGWRLFSLGLLVINVPALVEQWKAAELGANERAAIADLVFIEQAIKTYHESFGRWPDALEQLGPAPPNEVSPERAQLLSDRLASGTTDGYRFRYRVVTGTNGQIEGFELGAVPETYGATGRRSFFLDAQGKLHAADKEGAPATADDPIFTPQPESSSE